MGTQTEHAFRVRLTPFLGYLHCYDQLYIYIFLGLGELFAKAGWGLHGPRCFLSLKSNQSHHPSCLADVNGFPIWSSSQSYSITIVSTFSMREFNYGDFCIVSQVIQETRACLFSRLCPTLRSQAACQASLSMEFSRQEYWSGLPFSTPGDLPGPGIKTASLCLQHCKWILTTEPPVNPHMTNTLSFKWGEETHQKSSLLGE